MFSKLKLKLRNRIVWHFNFGLHAQRRLSGRYETLLWFTKGDDYTFNLDSIRVLQLYPGKLHSSSRGNLAGTPAVIPWAKTPLMFGSFLPRKHSCQTRSGNFPMWRRIVQRRPSIRVSFRANLLSDVCWPFQEKGM